MTSHKDTQCILCKKKLKSGTELYTVRINGTYYDFCTLCHNKLYYHFKDIIVNKIKHP